MGTAFDSGNGAGGRVRLLRIDQKSGRLSVVVLQEPANSFPAPNLADQSTDLLPWTDQAILDTLMVPFSVIWARKWRTASRKELSPKKITRPKHFRPAARQSPGRGTSLEELTDLYLSSSVCRPESLRKVRDERIAVVPILTIDLDHSPFIWYS